MATQEIRVGDIGTRLEVEVLEDGVAVDISAAVAVGSKQIIIERPDGTLITAEGVFSTDGTNGRIYHITGAGDINMRGTYQIQARIILPTWSGYSSVGEFNVLANLGA